jgi:hypothetical protein
VPHLTYHYLTPTVAPSLISLPILSTYSFYLCYQTGLTGEDAALADSIISFGAFDLYLAKTDRVDKFLPSQTPHASQPSNPTSLQLKVDHIIPAPENTLRPDVHSDLIMTAKTDLCVGGFLQEGVLSDGDYYGEEIDGDKKWYAGLISRVSYVTLPTLTHPYTTIHPHTPP